MINTLRKLHFQLLPVTYNQWKLFILFIVFIAALAMARNTTCLFASVSGSTAPHSLVSGRMFYSSPGSRWLTVHDLQRWMINGKKAHFIHRPAYLLAAHWYSCWKCSEKHSWMYGCGLHWRGSDIDYFVRRPFCLEATCALGVHGFKPQNLPADRTKCRQCRLMFGSWWEASAASFLSGERNGQMYGHPFWWSGFKS